MLRIILLIALIFSPGTSFAEPYSESSFVGLWCLTEMEQAEDGDKEFLELKFLEGKKFEYRINPLSSEPREGTFELVGDTLNLKVKQGISFRKFKISSVSAEQFVGKYFVKHTFTRGPCL